MRPTEFHDMNAPAVAWLGAGPGRNIVHLDNIDGDGNAARIIFFNGATGPLLSAFVANWKVDVDAGPFNVQGTAFVKNGQLIGRPEGWDFNSNDIGEEVVDDLGRVVFQARYSDRMTVTMRGIIYTNPGYLGVIGDDGIHFDPADKVDHWRTFKPIFLHPGRDHPGEMVPP